MTGEINEPFFGDGSMKKNKLEFYRIPMDFNAMRKQFLHCH